MVGQTYLIKDEVIQLRLLAVPDAFQAKTSSYQSYSLLHQAKPAAHMVAAPNVSSCVRIITRQDEHAQVL